MFYEKDSTSDTRSFPIEIFHKIRIINNVEQSVSTQDYALAPSLNL